MDSILGIASALPERLNLSLGYSCWVHCPGCYSVFGERSPDLPRFLEMVRTFVDQGLTAVTISGGDPLRLANISTFLHELRKLSVSSIKLDTVGTAMHEKVGGVDCDALLASIDILGLPCDGWDDVSVGRFRRGRPHLFEETLDVLRRIDRAREDVTVYVNTVAHQHNVKHLARVFDAIADFRKIRRWNVFQYMPTDRADPGANGELSVSDSDFHANEPRLRSLVTARRPDIELEFAANASRLGKYLLINGDGVAWLPDARGRTIWLGHVFGREREVLAAWQRRSWQLRERRALLTVVE